MLQEGTFSKELDTLLKFIIHSLINELPSLVITPEYLILGILSKRDCLAYKVLSENIDSTTLEKIYTAFYESAGRKTLIAIRPNSEPKYNEASEKIFELADTEERDALGGEKLNSLHVLLALLNPHNEEKIIRKVFETAKLDYSKLLEKCKELMSDEYSPEDNAIIELPEDKAIEEIIPIPGIIAFSAKTSNPGRIKALNFGDFIQEMAGMGGGKKQSTLENLCENLNERVVKGQADPFIGREAEMSQLINVLGRKKKNNAIIVGADGVGKTALCEGLAYKIVNGEVPAFLAGKIIWKLNLASLVAGTQYRGLLEDRFQNLIKELKNQKRNILFVDDISAMFTDKKNSDVDFGTILNSLLIDNTVQMIGSCGFKGYRTSFDSNPSLARKFQKIVIEEPSDEETLDILHNLQPSYEEYHKVKYDEDAIKLCISLAKKYIPERHLPDSAIDIFDECGTRENISNSNSEFSYSLYKEISDANKQVSELKKHDKMDDAANVEKQISELKVELAKEMKRLGVERIEHPAIITTEKVYQLVSDKTGIKINRLSTDEKKMILSMNDELKSSIIGQDEAIDTVCRAIKRNRVGLGGKKTMGAFLLIGRTGLGKTLLAKQLAKLLFGDEKYLVRIDMSEYEDKTAVNKLIGSSAGYVGYENGGLLTETIKNRKYCVLLLDEFEKADPEIYNIFLQVFDEGYLSDNTGQKIDFKNVLVILTSNVGAKAANEFGKGISFSGEEDNSNKILEKELKKQFSPEFLNRLDDIVYFNSLTDDNLKSIIKLELNKLNARLNVIGHSIEYDSNVIDFILSKLEDRDYGARPIIRLIQDNIENPITDLLLENEYSNHIFKITCFPNDGSLTIA